GGTGTGATLPVASRDGRHGVVGGGDCASAGILDNFARSGDGGKTWHLTSKAPVPGAIFGLAYAQSKGDRGREAAEEDRGDGDARREQTKVAVTGPGGAAWTADEGDHLVFSHRGRRLLGGRVRQRALRLAGRHTRADSQDQLLSRDIETVRAGAAVKCGHEPPGFHSPV